ncbi:DUF7133 domain-containing protein [Tautonia plasticadhaerens]|uniref:Cytochrome c domain-containing protein n=1 Tax=Tautonia plasticadhaerens TaxID=2527974 RepID=A0A518H365_9BACT|nr:hypothetical protein [Tautonia plasticadhaerens]QDV35281.1 hypothetical protein ElP_31840 [Tautonia plasticadhaerens]
MRIRTVAVVLAPALLFALAGSAAPQEVAGLRVPAGFSVSEFAGSDLANDIQCLTIAPDGRVIVSGRGYVSILVDDDEDGRADRALPFAEGPEDGAMGLLREGDSLFVVGDGGLRRYRDADGDDRADGPSELIRAMTTGSEHDAHAVRRGPDGWLYVMIGNFAGIDASYASLPTSPIADPVAGCLVRFPPDFGGSEIVADGFRNAYDFDFNPDGEVFAYDSDNERCVSLPWYEPTRFYHVVPGGHHGWLAPQRTETWRLPPWAEDVVPPVAPIDRGSPTGVVCYRHEAFPERYRGGFFLLDWTFGRVFFARPRQEGASYVAEPEVFLRATGSEGYAWTDAEVHPGSGDLFLSIGGRGTRGAVYRVRYEGEGDARGVAETERRRGGAGGRLEAGVIGGEVGTDRIVEAAGSDDELERLRALVELGRRGDAVPAGDLSRAIRGNWDHPDRLLRSASAALIRRLGPGDRVGLAASATSDRQRTTLGFGIAGDDPEAALGLASEVLGDEGASPSDRLAASRLVQVALGGQPDPALIGTAWEGYSGRLGRSASGDPEAPETLAARLRSGFPSGDLALDREQSRALAMLEDDHPDSLELVAERLTGSSDPIDDLHHLIVIGRLRAPRTPEVTSRVADSLLALDRKLDDRGANRDRNWPLRVSELYEGLADRDPELHRAMIEHPEFGRASHALFARSDGFDRLASADRFLDRAEADPGFSWDADVVAVLGDRPTDWAIDTLRSLWGEVGLDEAILPILARNPSPQDRPKFADGLGSTQRSTVSASLGALEALGPSDDPEEWLALVLALRRAPDDESRRRLSRFLARSTGRDLGPDPSSWSDWLARHSPDLAGRLSGGDGVDAEAWERRLAGIDWSTGDASRGEGVFQKAQCGACHSGNRAVGPDLAGVAGRFSREDLFRTIVLPSRDVADRYRSIVVATSDGNIHQGVVIYDAADSLILQAGATETVLLRPGDVEERRSSDASLMPAGLLDDRSDREIADLDAYLRSLGSADAAGR